MIATLDNITAIGNLTGCDEKLIAPYFSAAAQRLKTLIGSDEYAAAEADPDSYKLLAQVEAELVLYCALPGLNTVFSQTGGITIDGRVGDGGYRYMTPSELEQRRQQLLDDVETGLRDAGYLTYTAETVEKAEANEDEDA